MNRLILIGNGFDLAHGMKTSYKDFILWYLQNSFNSSKDKSTGYEDILVKVICNNSIMGKVDFKEIKNIGDFVKYIKRKNAYVVGSSNYSDADKDKYMIVECKSNFVENLLDKSALRWVDIESEYYDSLKEIVNSSKPEKLESKILAHNLELSYIMKKLKEYINENPDCSLDHSYSAYTDLLKQPIKFIDFTTLSNDDVNAIVGTQTSDFISIHGESYCPIIDSMIVNFNYTKTIERYINDTLVGIEIKNRPQVNYIHGKYTEDIIFGF